MKIIEGSVDGSSKRFGLVVARFNHFVTEPLLDGAVAALKEHGVRDEDMTITRVPGTFELPRRHTGMPCLPRPWATT